MADEAVVVAVDAGDVAVGADEAVDTEVARMPCPSGAVTAVVAEVDTEETATAVEVVVVGKRFPREQQCRRSTVELDQTTPCPPSLRCAALP